MNFGFDEDQLLFQTALRDFLDKECTPDVVRGFWRGEASELWTRLAALGVPGLRIPEEHGGMGLDEIDAVLLFEEAGRAALPEPVIATAAVGAPLLSELAADLRARRWLEPIAAGRARLAVADPQHPLVGDADVARLLLLFHADEVHAVEASEVTLTHQPANDPSRRLFRVAWSPGPGTRLADGARGRALRAAALDRGALAAAAELIGVADRLIEMAAAYAGQRQQFGRPIGSFQAVKHMLASAKVELEYARPAVYRAAHSVARGVPGRGLHVSTAKLLASQAAARAARTALQVLGAIGYTWEQDLHIWMRRAWSLGLAWGGDAFHRSRVGQAILAADARLGPGQTFAPAGAEAD